MLSTVYGLPLSVIGAQPNLSCKRVLWVAILLVLHSTGYAQWVISAIHPDPTPPLGAPDAEYVALLARGPSDSCLALHNHELRWNGHTRVLPNGCWPSGSVLVVHRASDSAAFNFGDAIPLGLSSWPALVNGGGTVSLWDDIGQPMDAMPYDAADLVDGGQPLLRRVPDACGGRSNQHSWSPGMDPFHHPWPEATQSALVWPSTDRIAQEASDPKRLVPRGAGRMDWYVGGGIDPASILQAKAWVDGMQVDLTWRSDSVAQLSWSHRTRPFWSGGHGEMVVQIGPLKACGPGGRHRSLLSGWEPVEDIGRVEVVGILPDPVSGDPERPEEALTILNQETEALELGPWSFGGGYLKRSTVLPALGEIRLEASAFEDWPGLANAGGELDITSGSGRPLVELAWDPCDYSLPEHVGSGLGLERAAVAGAAWGTSGWADDRPGEPWSIKGYGCPTDFWGTIGLDLYLDRHIAQLPNMHWHVDGQDSIAGVRIPGHSDAMRLVWDGMGQITDAINGIEVQARIQGHDPRKIRVSCPDPDAHAEPPCLRITEVMWNAHEQGSEFVEVMNCSGYPLDLAGLQATTVQDPFPSDWRYWVAGGTSLVLPAGGVAAFGPCDTWMTNGLPASGPSRWSVESWSALNDEAGQLAIRLPGTSATPLDAVAWGDWIQRPWWQSDDGWSWMRTSVDGSGWAPSHDRGSPGREGANPTEGSCRDAVEYANSKEGSAGVLSWHFPDAGGKMTIRIVHWPSGSLLDEIWLERPLTEGTWVWNGLGAMSLGRGAGHLILEVCWWSGSCRGRRLFRSDMPWKE